MRQFTLVFKINYLNNYIMIIGNIIWSIQSINCIDIFLFQNIRLKIKIENFSDTSLIK